MIKEAYCSFEIAKLLKEKGFNSDNTDVVLYYNSDGGVEPYHAWVGAKPNDYYAMPTHQMAMAWLREKGVYFSLVPFIENVGWPKNTWHINFYNSDGIMGGGFPVKGYEEAVEKALRYSLENLI